MRKNRLGGVLGVSDGVNLGLVLGGVLKTGILRVYRGFERFWGGC